MSETGRRGKNMIWQYFDKIDDEHKEAECKLCHNLFNYRSTSHNLKNHLRHKHNDVYMSIPPTETVTPKIIKIRKNRASVWEYYEIFDNEKKIASCNECQKTISYKTTTANLKSHLRRSHKDKYNEMEGIDGDEEVYQEDDGDAETDRRLRKTSVAWNYFTLVDDEKKVAACNTCDSHMSFRSSISNLMKHLKRKHGGIETKMFEDDKDTESEGDEPIKANPEEEEKLQSPPIRDHFEITNTEKKIATCSVCQVPMSYKSSIQVLLKHLRKHNIDIGDEVLVSSEDEERKPESPPPHLRSNVWPYFRITDAAFKTARCLVCRKLLSYNTGTSNLRKHLMRRHPLINLPAPGEERKTIILSSGDQLYEYEVEAEGQKGDENDDNDDQSEPIAIDEVFLDEFNGSINRIQSGKKYKSKKRKLKEKKPILLEQSDSDDELISKKHAKKEDSIDLFGKYIVSLLKELPKSTSNRLQKEFVKQIMNAQLENGESSQVEQNNGYSITIADAGAAVPEDVRFEVITTKPEVNK